VTCREAFAKECPSRRAVPRWLHVKMAGAALGALLLPVVTTAHARLVRSSPADGMSLPAAPAQLALCFNELLERQFHAIELEAEPRPSSQPSRGPLRLTPVVDPRDGTCLTVRVPSLEPGTYVLRWRVVSRDGHATRGLVRFRIG
jgi:methionine-rich copper-binding protein CopC